MKAEGIATKVSPGTKGPGELDETRGGKLEGSAARQTSAEVRRTFEELMEEIKSQPAIAERRYFSPRSEPRNRSPREKRNTEYASNEPDVNSFRYISLLPPASSVLTHFPRLLSQLARPLVRFIVRREREGRRARVTDEGGSFPFGGLHRHR